MKQITFTVKVAGRNPNGGAPIPAPVEWKGYQSETPGLVVHRRVERGCIPGDVWVITHLGSGFTIPYFCLYTRKAALLAAKELGEVTDWGMSMKHIESLYLTARIKLSDAVFAISKRYKND